MFGSPCCPKSFPASGGPADSVVSGAVGAAVGAVVAGEVIGCKSVLAACELWPVMQISCPSSSQPPHDLSQSSEHILSQHMFCNLVFAGTKRLLSLINTRYDPLTTGWRNYGEA